MAEQTFQGASVRATEIDLTAPGQITPQGVPAGIIGTALKGPAFVPVTFATKADFDSTFGASLGTQDQMTYSAISVYEWLRSARSCTFLRVLGCGDATKRSTSDGTVTNAGFVVGARQVQADGLIGHNAYANQVNTFQTESAATATITAATPGSLSNAATFTLTNAAGTTTTYRINGGGAYGTQAGGTAGNTIDVFVGGASTVAHIAEAVKKVINATTGGDMTATDDGTDVTVTQGTTGPDGNTTSVNNSTGLAAVGNFSGGAVRVESAASLGRTYFLGAVMKETPTDEDMPNYLQDAGVVQYNSASILRGVLMAPSGVSLTLSGWDGHSSVTASAYSFGKTGEFWDNGHAIGAIDLSANGDSAFVLMLNGFKSSTWPNILTASMNPESSNYMTTKFNTDPSQIEERGHYLYADYPVWAAQATIVDGDAADPSYETRLFLVTGSGARNATDAAGVPNYEGFVDRYTHPASPWIISQTLGGKNVNLFKIHSVDDGDRAKIKITIENLEKSATTSRKYGRFDLIVRSLTDRDEEPVVLDEFRGLDLDPRSDNYIARRIGDMHMYYDFDKNAGGQKLVNEGMYPLRGKRLIRVEMNDDFANGEVDATALPVGFRGYPHLVTSGSSFLSCPSGSVAGKWSSADHPSSSLRMRQPPIPFRQRITDGESASTRTPNSSYTWGVHFFRPKVTSDPNKTTKYNGMIDSMLKYFPDYGKTQPAQVFGNEGTAVVNGSIIDCDDFNNNIFSLERILVKTQSSQDVVDHTQWRYAWYDRTGAGSSTNTDRHLNVAKDFGFGVASKKYYKFSFPLVGGFNGLNIFNDGKAEMSNNAAFREMVDSSNQGGTSGPTVAAYRKAVDVMAEKADVDIQVLAIPGLRTQGISDYAIAQTEERFDAIYIMDIEECNEYGAADGNVITGSSATESEPPINVTNTISRLDSRNLDSSFAAVYFPDVVVQDLHTGNNVRVPPSAAMIGAYANNDKLAYPWYAPAGFTRGALATSLYAKVDLNEENRGSLYNSDINPIVVYPGQAGVLCMGQKTLLKAQSALDRVNVRRLLIDIRRKVRAVANTVLFEPNRESTLASFSARVEPILARIQSQQGLDRFKVIIDTTTTTQADVENNTIRGKIFLQPTRAVEFISLDFVITNAGAEI